MATSKKRLYLSGADRIFLISKLSGDYGEQALRLSKYFRKSLWEEGLEIPSNLSQSQEQEPEAPEPSFDEAAFAASLGLEPSAPQTEEDQTSKAQSEQDQDSDSFGF